MDTSDKGAHTEELIHHETLEGGTKKRVRVLIAILDEYVSSLDCIVVLYMSGFFCKRMTLSQPKYANS